MPEVLADFMINCLVPESVSVTGSVKPTPEYSELVPSKVIEPLPDFIVIRPHW